MITVQHHVRRGTHHNQVTAREQLGGGQLDDAEEMQRARTLVNDLLAKGARSHTRYKDTSIAPYASQFQAYTAPLPADLAHSNVTNWMYKHKITPTFPQDSPPSFLHCWAEYGPVCNQGNASPQLRDVDESDLTAAGRSKRARFEPSVLSPAAGFGRELRPRTIRKVDGKGDSLSSAIPAPPLRVAPETMLGKSDKSLSQGSIRRCIPHPHRHMGFARCDYSPADQRVATIYHSFLDPPSSTTFPCAEAVLVPGRRGTWLLPLSGPLPIQFASVPLWIDPSSSSSSKSRSSGDTNPLVILWTDKRLKAFWAFLTAIHANGPMGSVSASCHSASSALALPDHIRIEADGHLALSLCTLLERPKASDKIPFLRDKRWVWCDESGNAVLIAGGQLGSSAK